MKPSAMLEPPFDRTTRVPVPEVETGKTSGRDKETNDMTDLPDDEAPLDPATERLRRKMVRLLAVAIGTMLIGVMAVLGAVVYKVNQTRAPLATEEAIALALPAGSTIEDIALDGGEALLRLSGGPDALVRVDLATGTITGRYRIPTP